MPIDSRQKAYALLLVVVIAWAGNFPLGKVALREVSPSTFANLTPFVVLLLSWLIAGEQIHTYHVTAAAVVIAGVYLTTR